MANLLQIEQFLRSKRLRYKLVDLGEEIYTVAGVKEAGINPAEIVKTLVLRSNDGFIALSLLGDDRVDFKKTRAKFGSKSELARQEEVLKIVGAPVGAVCPILIGIPLYVDRQVLELESVHMGSGDLTKGLEMKLGDLLQALQSWEVIDFNV